MLSKDITRDGRIYGGANVELTPEVAAELGTALGTLLGEGVLVVTARDYYPPSRMLKRSFSAGLMSTGISVVDFHAATYPELAFAIKKFGAKAGAHFTVSLYRSNYINIRLLDYLGIEFSREKLMNLLRLYETRHLVRTLPERIGWVTYAEYIHEIYVASLTSYLDSDAILGSGLNLVADLNFGPSAEVVPNFFSELGVDAITLNAHKPPTRKGIKQNPSYLSILKLGRMVKASGASFGAALCVDASRVFFVDDMGRALPPDTIIALFASILPPNSTVVTTVSASKVIDKVAKKKRVRVMRVKDSPGDVSKQVRRSRAAYGGSDFGEHIFPRFSLASDGLLAIGRILEILAKTERKLSSMIDELPEVPVHTEEIILPSNMEINRVLDTIVERYGVDVLAPTGLKIMTKRGPVWIKPNYENYSITLSIEEPTKEKVEHLRRIRDEVSEVVRKPLY